MFPAWPEKTVKEVALSYTLVMITILVYSLMFFFGVLWVSTGVSPNVIAHKQCYNTCRSQGYQGGFRVERLDSAHHICSCLGKVPQK